MGVFAKIIAWYLRMVDYQQRTRNKNRAVAHFAVCMTITLPFTMGSLIYHNIERSRHPELDLREASVRAISGNPRLEPMMKAWLECFDNTLMNSSWGYCDLAVEKMVREQHLESDFEKFKQWRVSIHNSITSRFVRQLPERPPWDK
jgi:hypothetical protein